MKINSNFEKISYKEDETENFIWQNLKLIFEVFVSKFS